MMGKAKTSIIILLFLVSLLILYKGFQFYQYTKTEPGFCNTCHLMEEAFKDWRLSHHSGIICQRCHSLGIVEANRMLFSFSFKGKKGSGNMHGKTKAWQSCTDCHHAEVAQGSKTGRAAFGHAKHVYMQDIECQSCHRGDMHSFPVSNLSCQKCHKDKVVHGMGTAGLYCLNCHSFALERPKMISPERCYRCHEKLPEGAVMSSLRCYDCHIPHGELEIKSSDCLGRCHSTDATAGRHGEHLKKATFDCLLCHRPHTWTVTGVFGKKLCSRCHPYRDPRVFIK